MKKIFASILALIMLLSTFVVLAVPASASDVATNTFNANDDNPTISTAQDYIDFFNAAFVAQNKFSGKTITLCNDITINSTASAEWYKTAATKFTSGGGGWSQFEGIFDGNGHTINGVVVIGNFRGNDRPVGIFPYVANATIKNLTVDGFYVCNDGQEPTNDGYFAAVGGLVGTAGAMVTIDNCILENGIVESVNSTTTTSVGAIVGAYKCFASDMILNITNCVVEDTVKLVIGSPADKTFVGGIVGCVFDGANTIKNLVMDFSGSRIQPNGSMDDDVSLKPIGAFILSAKGTVPPKAETISISLKNLSNEYEKTLSLSISDANFNWVREDKNQCGNDCAEDVNEDILESGCYGSKYIEPPKFTVTWSVNGVETTETYYLNAVPNYKGSTDKPMTNTHIYVFTGWSPTISPVTADVTYTAQYSETIRVAVTWVVDGKTTVEYYSNGDVPSYKGVTDKEQDDDYIYTFKGWDKQILAATADVTYTAVYEAIAKYEITWIIDGKETKEFYVAGVKPSFKGKVEKTEDDEYTYKFIGWDKEIVAACEDAVYTAQFEKTAKNPTLEETETTTETSGCGSTVSIGFATVIAVGMAGAVIVRKRKD